MFMTTIDQVIADIIGSWMIDKWPIGNFFLCVIALTLSIILCGAVGIERERRGRTAGLRTHLLVGVGSCIIMIISIYGFPAIQINGVTLNRDVARLAAQVIAGVGFLGAGAIIHRGGGAKGLTTAATIWIVMAIGLACGSFNFILATVGTILILVVLTTFRKLEERMTKKTPLINLHAKKDSPILSQLLVLAGKHHFLIREFSSELDAEDNLDISFYATNTLKKDYDILPFIADIQKMEGVIDVFAPTINAK